MRAHPITYDLGADDKRREAARAKIARLLRKHHGSIREAAAEEGVAESVVYAWLAVDKDRGGTLSTDARKLREARS